MKRAREVTKAFGQIDCVFVEGDRKGCRLGVRERKSLCTFRPQLTCVIICLQVNALASLPKSVARVDVRGGGYRTGPPANDHRAGPLSGGRLVSGGHPVRADVEVPPPQPVKRKPGRPPKK